MSLWIWAGLAAAIYCLARGIMDLRQRAYAWGLVGIASAIVIVSTPYPTRILSVRVPAGLTSAPR